MAGHSAELERWLKPRGWTMKMGSNGHWKLYHDQCPHPLSASNTPSGPAIKKIQSVVMRTERQFGIIVEERRKGRPVTEPFKTRTEGDSVFHTAVCSECGETGEIRSQASSATITPAHITTRFRQKGWKSKAYRSEDLCPSCNGVDVGPAETKPVAEKPKPVTPVTLADIPLPPPPKPDIDRINVEALQRQQLAWKRKIAAQLSKVYLVDAGYLPGDSDETVARKVGNAPKELVEIVRRDLYGPDRRARPLDLLKRAIAGYRRDVKAFEQEILDRAAKLDEDAAQILKWLDAIGPGAVPKQPAEETPQGVTKITNGHDRDEEAA